jgi:hypothetical protein
MNNSNFILFFSIIVGCLLIGCNDSTKVNKYGNYNPQKDGYVPDDQTAVKVAEAIFVPMYGEDILKERPFHATLQNDSIWIITGSLNSNSDKGGVVHAEIRKKDCMILKVIHDK